MKKLLPHSLYLLVFISIAWLSATQLFTPEPALPGYSPDSYSAFRAIEHLKIIANEPHSGGTTAHKKVRNFIYDFCIKSGLETKVLDEVGMREYRTTAYAGNTYNILAKLKGSQNSKAILVMAHYDSQPNTPGAADDGSGVASMLETIDLLKNADALKNDIYFLFTDLEEVGLLGAEAFVKSYPELKDIGLILNFEARGNNGVSFTFETSSENGWAVREFAKASDKALGNSLAYEIYKLMPNDSDFTMFRDTGISGLNTAFIDGYSYYHSAVDTPGNINLGSLQHQGDLMLDFINHFGNTDLTSTKGEDVIFFNLFNKILIYPSSWDWPLVILITLIFCITLWILKKGDALSLSGAGKGSLLYIIAIVSTMLLAWFLNWLVITFNTHYQNFYSNNFYNASTYLWMYMGSAILSFGIIYKSIFKSASIESKIMGGLIVQLLLIYALKFYVPTGAFILYVPMITLLLILLIKHWVKSLNNIVAFTISILLPLILWVPFIYILYVVFSHSLPYASVFFMVLLFPYLVNLQISLNKIHKALLPAAGLLLIIGGFIAGQLTSGINDKQPLQSQLTYAINIDSKEAFWLSRQKLKDKFVEAYINPDSLQQVKEVIPTTNRRYWKDIAPVIDPNISDISVVTDTTINKVRQLKISIKPTARDLTYYGLVFPETAQLRSINSRAMTSESIKNVWFYAPNKAGDFFELEIPEGEDFEFTIMESKLGIDKTLLITPLPKDHIFGTGTMTNNMLFTRTIKL